MTDDKQFSKNDFEGVIRGLLNTKPRPKSSPRTSKKTKTKTVIPARPPKAESEFRLCRYSRNNFLENSRVLSVVVPVLHFLQYRPRCFLLSLCPAFSLSPLTFKPFDFLGGAGPGIMARR
jgi:hypothetical protein